MPSPIVTSAQVTSERRQALSRKVIDIQKVALVGGISPETMRVCIHELSINPSFKVKWLKLVDTAELNGTLHAPGFQTAVARALYREFDLSKRDPRSEYPFETAYTYFYPHAGVDNFWKINPYWLVKELAVEGQAGIVQGERGFGKTNHALYLCELLIQLKEDQIKNGPNSQFAHIRREKSRGRSVDGPARDGGGGFMGTPPKQHAFSSKMGLWNAKAIQFPTNISISPKDRFSGYFPRAAKMSEFVELMCRGAKSDRKAFSLVVPDEMGFSFNKRRAMTIHNFAIEQLLILIRKFDAALLAIAQSTDQQLPVSLTGSAQTKVQKLSKGTAIYEVQGLSIAQHIRSIPGTSIDFATRAFAPFGVDLVPSLLVDFVTEKEREAHDGGNEWTDDMMYDAAIQFCIENKATDAQIASGKSGVLRSEVRYYSQQLDPTTNRYYTAERIAVELEVEADKVKEIMKDLAKEAKTKRENAAKKAGHSEPVAAPEPEPVAEATESGGEESYDTGPDDDSG